MNAEPPTNDRSGAVSLPPADGLVTGEAVALDLRLAALPTRAMAIGIDLVLQLIALVALSGILAATPIDDASFDALSLVLVVAVIVGYPVAFETLTRGRTLGKMVFGLRVVRDDGGPERFRQALIRGLAEVVEIWMTFGVVALFVSLGSSTGKRFGDVLGGTVVVRERMPRAGGQTAWMRPELIPWALTADLSRVPDPLALSARQLIARWEDLDPVARQGMAVDLATQVGRFVSPPSPPGTAPEAYLAAVLVERRRREEQRRAAPSQVTAPPPAPTPWPAPPNPWPDLPNTNPAPAPAPNSAEPTPTHDEPGGFKLPG